jgi:hypothetical protein
METRIRRYFTFRKLNSKLPQPHQTTDDLALVSIPYASTQKGRAPVHSLSAPTREMGVTKDDLEVPVVRAFAYDSVVAGAPPVFGATPIKGNGPVKLQTSRRLSSGELLVTTQDHQRTLSDIREGEYIVGRKDPKRMSKTISIRLPIHSRASSPRTSLAQAPHLSTPSWEQSLRAEQQSAPKHIPEPLNLHKDIKTFDGLSPGASPRSPYSRNSSAARAYFLSAASELPLPLSPGQAPSTRTSLLSKGEEKNATIQALWKAEYTRLVAIYGQDGVDRNIAELNRDRLAASADRSLGLDRSARKVSAVPGVLRPPSLDTITPPPPLKAPGALAAQESPLVDNSSDYSSVNVPSLLASEESSSSYTKRTSLFEADVPTTREEVSRIVENMRKNYLKALEKTEEKPKMKRPRKSKQRASYAHTSKAGTPAPPGVSKGGRQSWHPSTAPGTVPAEKQSKKRSSSRTKATRESTAGSQTPTASKSSSRSKPQLHRADSTTLGSFFGSRRQSQNPPSPARTLKAPFPEKSNSMAQVDNDRPRSTASASSRTSSDNVAPEIDDFDIFYQDLAREPGPAPGNAKPAIPATDMDIPVDKEVAVVLRDEIASPPPNIDWTPRKHAVSVI